MSNRIIREGLLDSDKFNKKIDEACQMLFVRLMLIADDYGRGDARPEIIKAKCYPLSDISPSLVCKMLTDLNKAKLLLLYIVKNKSYFEILNFDQRLRQKREKFPKPTDALTIDSNVLTDDGRVQACLPESESESEVEVEKKRREGKGREGNKRCQSSKPIDPRYFQCISIFNKIWEEANRQGNPQHNQKDFALLKRMLKAQPAATAESFETACRSCLSDPWHEKKFRLGYVSTSYPDFINFKNSPRQEEKQDRIFLVNGKAVKESEMEEGEVLEE